ncbi:hypothetical protein C2W64_01712 [Brevibacillus laterosporus]|nr:hypothetical protein C2W64_01712 [Brevibacillus laterosporus]
MMTKTVFHVEGMSCKSCVAKVEKALNTIGVEHVQVELAEKQVEIEYDPNIIEAGFLKETVEKLGYKVV